MSGKYSEPWSESGRWGIRNNQEIEVVQVVEARRQRDRIIACVNALADVENPAAVARLFEAINRCVDEKENDSDGYLSLRVAVDDMEDNFAALGVKK